MGLKVHDRLFVPTPEGEREIQLCLGDITHLPVAEKVDIVIVSAYPNDYAAFRQTVIGALKYNLQISVDQLSRHHKQHDLRKSCSCWISHPLPEDKPYRQLICFERSVHNVLKGTDGGNHLMTTVQCVQGLFRAMMPAFNNTNKSVIMPLLGTGMQHVDRQQMMDAVVREAIDWQRRGLPLQLLKIVLYSRDLKLVGRDKDAAQTFSVWKKRLEAGKKLVRFKEPELKYDLMLIYGADDQDTAKLIRRQFTKTKVRVITPDDIAKSEMSQQHDLYTCMLATARVVPVLSNGYLAEEACIDMYNLALCARRRTKRPLLAPLCLQAIPLPPHMTMVQWISCKDYNEEKIVAACSSLAEQVEAEKCCKSQVVAKYDVFVSYSHRNLAAATLLLTALRDTQPQLSIFFDYEALKTGVSWQQTLYESLEQSRSVVALVSADYLASPVCAEEFSIALARHLAKAKDCELIPVLLDDTVAPPAPDLRYIHAPDPAATFPDLARRLCEWLDTGAHCDLLSLVPEPIDAVEASQSLRQHAFQENYDVEAGHVTFKPSVGDKGNGDKGNGDQGKGDQGKGDKGKGDKDNRDKGNGDQGKGDKGKGDKGKGDKGKGDKGNGDKGKGDKGKGDKGKGDKDNRDKGKGDKGKGDKDNGDKGKGDKGNRDKGNGDKGNGDKDNRDKGKGDKGKGDKGNGDKDNRDKGKGEDNDTEDGSNFVFLSYSARDDVYAHCLKSLLSARRPALRFSSKTGRESEVMHAGKAACFVVLLSPRYIVAEKERDEFHVILSKQRATPQRKVMYTILVDDLPATPTYLHLVAIDTALTDDVWRRCARQTKPSAGAPIHVHLQQCADAARKNFGEVGIEVLVATSKAAADLECIVDRGSYPCVAGPAKGVLHNVLALRKSAETPHVVTFTNDDTDLPTAQQKLHRNHTHGDQAERDQAGGDQAEGDQAEGEKAGGDQAERDQAERDQAEGDHTEDMQQNSQHRKGNEELENTEVPKGRRTAKSFSCNLL